jgi:hypothetical protein
LAQTGYELISRGTLPAVESQRWSSGWVMIEARK